MLSRRRALHFHRPLHHPMHHLLRHLPTRRIVQDDGVEIPIPDMPHNRPDEPIRLHIRLRLLHALRQPRNRHRHVRRPHPRLVRRVRRRGHDAPERLLTRAPQLAGLILVARKLKGPTARALRLRAHRVDRLPHRPWTRPGELEEQSRHLLPALAHRAAQVHAPHLLVVQQLHRRDRHPRAHRPRHALGGVLDGGEPRDRHAAVRGLRRHLERCLRYEPQRALGPNHQPREIVPGRRLPRPLPRLDHRPVREHHRQIHHPVPHGAVPVRVGARAPRAHHPADHGAGPGVRREEQAVGAEALVELLPPERRLDDAVEVVGVHGQEGVHAGEVDADAAVQGREVALEGGAAGVGHDGDAAAVEDLHDGADVGGGRGAHDAEGAVGRGVRVAGPGGARVGVEFRGVRGDVFRADNGPQVNPACL